MFIKLTIHNGFTHKSKPISFYVLSEIKLRDLFRLIIMVFYPGYSMTDTYICDNFTMKIIESNNIFDDILININTLYQSLTINGFVSDAKVFILTKSDVIFDDRSDRVKYTYNLDPVIQDSKKISESCAIVDNNNTSTTQNSDIKEDVKSSDDIDVTGEYLGLHLAYGDSESNIEIPGPIRVPAPGPIRVPTPGPIRVPTPGPIRVPTRVPTPTVYPVSYSMPGQFLVLQYPVSYRVPQYPIKYSMVAQMAINNKK